ncbi:TPA: hypothetical protein ACRUQG_002318 [Escherichia coli]
MSIIILATISTAQENK